jgi:hypothetical protein
VRADRRGLAHSTHEFYRERARMTRRLIEQAGFDAIAVEADWPAEEGEAPETDPFGM